MLEISVVEYWQEYDSAMKDQVKIGVRTLLWKTELDKSILSWKTEYPDCCITVVRIYYKEGGCCRRWACRLNIDKTVSLWGCIFWIGGLSIWHN